MVCMLGSNPNNCTVFKIALYIGGKKIELLTLFLSFCSSNWLLRLAISSSFLSTLPCNSAMISSLTFNLEFVKMK